jgi:hypothetical protein
MADSSMADGARIATEVVAFDFLLFTTNFRGNHNTNQLSNVFLLQPFHPLPIPVRTPAFRTLDR